MHAQGPEFDTQHDKYFMGLWLQPSLACVSPWVQYTIHPKLLKKSMLFLINIISMGYSVTIMHVCMYNDQIGVSSISSNIPHFTC
jgi:hypothetical protein